MHYTVQVTISQQYTNVVEIPDSSFSLEEDPTRYFYYNTIASAFHVEETYNIME